MIEEKVDLPLTVLIENIRDRMKKKGWKIEDLAQHSGAPLGTVKSIFYLQSKNPGVYTLAAIANSLDCQVDDLISPPTAQSDLTEKKYNEVKTLAILKEMDLLLLWKIITVLDRIISEEYLNSVSDDFKIRYLTGSYILFDRKKREGKDSSSEESITITFEWMVNQDKDKPY